MQLALDHPETPARRRFDVAAYYRMAETGILSPRGSGRVIDGEIVEIAPIGSAHAGTTNRLTSLVGRLAAERRVVASIQSPLCLDPFNEPQPDLMLLRPRADDDVSAIRPPPTCCSSSKVADSSLAFVRGPKLALYARHGVPEVWIVDLVGRALEICRAPGPEGYGDRRRVTEGVATPTLVTGLAIDVATLLA